MRRKVSIVLYHDPRPDIFEKHVQFLSKHYNFISLNILVSAIKNRDWSLISNNSMVITFDDGHKGNYELLEIIKKYNIIPTIYCCSDIISTNRHFWWKEVGLNEIEGFKKITNAERLNQLEEKGYSLEKEYNDRQALSLDEINDMMNFVEFESHTKFHPILTCCTKKEKKDEIINSKSNIESVFSNECQHFCYPNGDYDEEVIDIVKSSGYDSARTIDVGWNDINTDPYKLKITGITDDASITQVIAQLTGITMFLRYLSKGSLKGLHKTIKPTILK